MNNRMLALLLAATLSISACGRSEDGAAVLRDLDPDKDGTLDLKEAQAGGAKKFSALNPDNDGTLDAEELSGRLDAAGLKAADPDNEGTLDPKEYEALIAELFKAANPDNDALSTKQSWTHQQGRTLSSSSIEL